MADDELHQIIEDWMMLMQCQSPVGATVCLFCDVGIASLFTPSTYNR